MVISCRFANIKKKKINESFACIVTITSANQGLVCVSAI